MVWKIYLSVVLLSVDCWVFLVRANCGSNTQHSTKQHSTLRCFLRLQPVVHWELWFVQIRMFCLS